MSRNRVPPPPFIVPKGVATWERRASHRRQPTLMEIAQTLARVQRYSGNKRARRLTKEM